MIIIFLTLPLLSDIVPVVCTFCDPKSGATLVPAIAALALTFELVIAESAILPEVTARLAIFAVITASLVI